MNKISWQLNKYNDYIKKIYVPPKSKWSPIILNEFSSDFFDNISEELKKKIEEKISLFLEIYMIIDSDIPEYVSPLYLKPEKQYPKDWIQLKEVMAIIANSVSEYMTNNSEVNLEIVKEYYNIITGKKTLLLKDKENNRVVLDFNLKKEFENKLLTLIDDEILGILDSGERKRLLREKKLNRIVNDLDD